MYFLLSILWIEIIQVAQKRGQGQGYSIEKVVVLTKTNENICTYKA